MQSPTSPLDTPIVADTRTSGEGGATIHGSQFGEIALGGGDPGPSTRQSDFEEFYQSS